MKLCILSHCFYPSKNRGGPTVSITNMVKALASKFEISVVTYGKDKGCDSFYNEVVLGKNHLFGADVYYLTQNTIKAFETQIKAIQPDIIYVSSLFSYQYSIPAILYAKRNKNVRLIMAPRGELMPEALKRRRFVKKLFLFCTRLLTPGRVDFHATSDDEMGAIKRIFKKNAIWKIRNLPSSLSANKLKDGKKPGKASIVMVGRVHPIKNIHYALEILQSVKGEIAVDVYGPLENEEYLAKCKSLASKLDSNITVNFKGTVNHEDIGKILEKYDIFLSPTKSENFGHSIVEALISGTPVVISNNTPWHELEKHCAGFDISLDSPDLFINAINFFVDMDAADYELWSQGATTYISKFASIEEDQSKYVEMFLAKRE